MTTNRRPQESYLDDVPMAMSDYSLPASAIEAAARDFHGYDDETWGELVDMAKAKLLADVEAALRAAFDELGMERDFYEKPTRSGEGPSTKYRLVSRWMPKEESRIDTSQPPETPGVGPLD